MSRMIFWFSFVLIIASVFLIGLALYQPVASGYTGNPALFTSKSKPLPAMPETSATWPMATPAPVAEKTATGLTLATPPLTPPPGVLAKTIGLQPEAQAEHGNDKEIAELKTAINQLQDQLKKRDDKKGMLDPQTADGKYETLLVLDGKVFRPGQVEFSQDARESIDRILPRLKEQAGDVVLVEGHSDSYSAAVDSAAGSEENRKFSLLRAQSVARALEQQGVQSDRILVRGYGDTRPVTSNATQDGRARNRRVEIKLVSSLAKQ